MNYEQRLKARLAQINKTTYLDPQAQHNAMQERRTIMSVLDSIELKRAASWQRFFDTGNARPQA